MDCFIPKFKLKYGDSGNIEADSVNTVFFNLRQIKCMAVFCFCFFFWGGGGGGGQPVQSFIRLLQTIMSCS